MTRHFTTAEFAEMFACTGDKVTDLIKSGELAAIDISLRRGGKPRWRIPQDAVDDFIRRRRSQPPAPPPNRKRRQPAEITQYY
jgi:excisionase family DNA binding protein